MESLYMLLTTIGAFVASVLVALFAFLAPFIGVPQQELFPTPLIEETSTVLSDVIEPEESVSVAASQDPEAAATPEAEAVLPEPAQIESELSPPPLIDAATLESLAHAALVNIFCTLHNGSRVQTVSGSGVFIDARGVILTNAHVGQFFLLKDYPTNDATECVVRSGDPARDRYRATLLYLPPAWIETNAAQIAEDVARGTGEHDYAFLLVNDVVGESGFPSSFPSLSMTLTEPKLGSAVLLAAYPAEDLKSRALEKRLHILSAYAGVTKLFTFSDEGVIDLFSVGGTEVSQGGSSGGPVVRMHDGRLEGIITTASSRDDKLKRDLRAITLAHINRSLAAEGEDGIVELLSQNVTAAAAEFARKIAPAEKDALVQVLED